VSLLVLAPTRGRPQKAVELLDAFRETVVLPDTALLCVVDEDDPQLDTYLVVLPPANVEVNETVGSMGAALQASATLHAAMNVYTYLGFMGDDHRPRTTGWDKAFNETLDRHGGGYAYGNDLFQGQNLPTQVVMNTSIVNQLGWMAPPGLRHLYFDNAWKFLGESVDRLFYLYDVIIEHVHPFAGKSEWDEGYARVNDPGLYQADRATYEQWQRDRSAADIETIKRVIGA
jgi:hypothetical protein